MKTDDEEKEDENIFNWTLNGAVKNVKPIILDATNREDRERKQTFHTQTT